MPSSTDEQWINALDANEMVTVTDGWGLCYVQVWRGQVCKWDVYWFRVERYEPREELDQSWVGVDEIDAAGVLREAKMLLALYREKLKRGSGALRTEGEVTRP